MNTPTASLAREKPEDVVLRVSFDINQLGNRLVWYFDDEHPVPPPQALGGHDAMHRYGRHAGSVHFNQGDRLSVQVYGYGCPGEFETFEVTDCTLVTMPAPYLQHPPPPSPFDLEHATQELEFGAAKGVPKSPDGTRLLMARGKNVLKVVQDKGVWDMSLYVTVAITRKVGVTTERVLRVFLFDPESEVGIGVTR